MVSILMVFTSAGQSLVGGKIGWYLPEAAHPYYAFTAAGFAVDFTSPAGPNPPVDPKSVKDFTDDESTGFLKDETVTHKLASMPQLKDVDASAYDAIFYVGGHGPVIDLAENVESIALAGKFWSAGKIVAAVCHGPGALVNVTDSQGKNILAGRSATCFSNAEEEAYGGTMWIPFLVETRIEELGGKYEKAAELWGVHVVVDGQLYSGQNPASAKALGEAVAKALTSGKHPVAKMVQKVLKSVKA